MRRLAFGFVFVSAIGVAAATAQTPPPVALQMVELPTLPGYDSCSARAINNRGQVIGECTMEGSVASHAFVWEEGVPTDLGTLGGVSSRASAINDKGQIVGDSFTSSGDVEAFLWERGSGMTSIAQGDHRFADSQRASASAINEEGKVAGTRFVLYQDAGGEYSQRMVSFLWEKDETGEKITDILSLYSTRPTAINSDGQVLIGPWETRTSSWLWDGESAPQLKPLGSAPYHSAFGNALDDDGQVVGWSESADDSFRATRWTTPTAGPMEIPMPTSVIHSQAHAVSGKGGRIVGTWLDGEGSSHGFFWDGVSPTATEIGFLYDGRSTSPQAVNNSGQVVGICDTQPAAAGVRDHACLWQGGVLTDLGALGGGKYSVALDINELGQAVGESLIEPGSLRAVLWTPLLSPEQKIEALIRQVEALVDDGELAKGPGNALVASLQAALKQLKHGNQGTVCNVLQAFVNKVEAFVTAGTLSEADGVALLAAVNAIIADLCG